MKAKKKMEKVRFKKFYSLLIFSLFLFFILIFLFSFCSSLIKKLPLMRSYRGSKTGEMQKMPEMMMLVIIRFSCLRSLVFRF